jgi:putative endopeptidase
MQSGIEIAERNDLVHPGDDLYLHMNGRWLESSTIPEDKARYGAFTLLAEEAEKAVREIIEAADSAQPGTAEAKVRDLYASFMDEARIEAVGVAPLVKVLENITDTAQQGREALAVLLGSLERQGVDGFLQLFIDNDPGNPERYIVFIEQGGISLPDEAYYRQAEHAALREAFVAHLERVFGSGRA